jgi:hypothetical protein
MRWRLRYLAIGAVGFFVIGCSEKADGPPTGPEFHTITPTTTVCDVGHISQLANSFFQQPRQGTVKNLVDLLATETFYSPQAKNTGFDIMAQIEGAVNDATSGDPAVGSNLMNHLLLCMYNPSSEATSYPETFPEDFTVSLTPASHGAFGERSGASPAAVLSRPFSATYTGIAPPEGSTGWGVTNSPARVVLYGRPAPVTPDDQKTYDWRSIPHNANFSPGIIIGFCVDPIANPTTMVLEQGVAVLAFTNAYFLQPGVGGNCSSGLGLVQGTSPFQLAHRLLRFGTDLLAPRPLMATVLTSGSGGTKSKCCSIVGPKDVPSASGALSNVSPNRIKVNTGRFSITATAMSGTDPVNGTKVTLSTAVNNGANSSIRSAPLGTPCSQGVAPEGITGTGTNLPGQYVFNNLCFTNTGNIYVFGTFNVEGRNDTPVTVKSNKINVIP